MRPDRVPARVLLCTLAILALGAATAWSNAPRIENVQARATPTHEMEVTYDLQGLGDRRARVRLLYSRDGAAFQEARRVQGDVGDHIEEGAGRRIVWDAVEEIGALRDTKLQVRVEADPASISPAPSTLSPQPPPPPVAGDEALVFVTTDQDDLRVELLAGGQHVQRGQLGGSRPFQATVKPGAYLIRITRDEHHPYEKAFSVGPGGTWRERVNLVAAYGWLDLTVVPDDASVTVDGVPVVRSQGTTAIKLPQGSHRVEVSAGDRWVPAPPREASIPDGGRRVALRIELEPRFGGFALESTPSGARVSLNGAEAGTTPLPVRELLEGRYEVCLELPLHVRECFGVEMLPRVEIRRTVTLAPNFGELSLRGSPGGAHLFRIGERERFGSLPVERLRLPPGKHQFEVRSEPDFDPERVEVEIEVSVHVSREVQLKRRTGRVLVVSDPPSEGATVRIGGVEVGKTPFASDELPTGEVEVDVVTPDGAGRLKVQVEARRQKIVTIPLHRSGERAQLPDLRKLIPFVSASLGKPPVGRPQLEPPPVPADLPALPLASLALPDTDKPTAFLPPVRTLPCALAVLPIAGELLECGRARYARGELDEAAKTLEQAVRAASERDVVTEARYWLAETRYRMGRVEQADWLFRQVAQDSPRMEYGLWGLHGSGWTALRLLDTTRARAVFSQLLSGPLPAPVEAWARHGLGLASYALARFPEAEAAWRQMAARGIPVAVAGDVQFWHGEALGRLGHYDAAVAALLRLTRGGPHRLREPALVRLGWWRLAAGHFADGAATFRQLLSSPRPSEAGVPSPERDWAEAGLALALLSASDADGARAAVRGLAARRSPLALPVQLRLLRVSLAASRSQEAQAIAQELLASTLPPVVRAWVLLMKGEAHRAEGNLDEARTQYDLARKTDAGSSAVAYATYQLAQVNFELREFAQAMSDLAALLQSSPGPELRAAALLLEGEAAYHAGDHGTATGAFRRALAESPAHPLAANARLALAWTALRQRQSAEAQRQFAEFARAHPDHPHAADALMLAGEIALASDDLEVGRELLDRVLTTHGAHPRAGFARLNRAILDVRTGAPVAAAEAPLRDWITRAPFPELLGRVHVALGVALLADNPVEAARQFTEARREGAGAIASLGVGVALLAQQQWEAAALALTDARDTGTAPIVSAAKSALQVIAQKHLALSAPMPPAPGAVPAATGALQSQDVYQAAYIKFSGGAYSLAIAGFREFLRRYPAHELADNAQYCIGEAYFSLARRYANAGQNDRAVQALEQAVQEFRRVVANYPRGDKAPTALYKEALALIELKQRALARSRLQYLIDTFPQAEETPLARERLAALNAR